MQRRFFVLPVIATLCLTTKALGSENSAAVKPNVVIIFTDDQGYQVIADEWIGGTTGEIEHQRQENDIEQQVGKELFFRHG